MWNIFNNNRLIESCVRLCIFMYLDITVHFISFIVLSPTAVKGCPSRCRLYTEQICHACWDDKRRERPSGSEKMQCPAERTGHNYSIVAHSHSTFTLCQRLQFSFSLHTWQGVHLSDSANKCYVGMHKRLKCTYGYTDMKTVTGVTGALDLQSWEVKTWPHLLHPYCSLWQFSSVSSDGPHASFQTPIHCSWLYYHMKGPG